MLIASVVGQWASFASGRLVQSMYQDNMLVKYQIELGRHDDKTPSSQMWLWLARGCGVNGNGVGRLAREEARTSAQKVGQAVQKWRFFARQSKANSREIEMLSTAFEHNDLKASLKPASVHATVGKPGRKHKT